MFMFSLMVGVCVDYVSCFGIEWSLCVYVVWKLVVGWVVKGGWGYGFKVLMFK